MFGGRHYSGTTIFTADSKFNKKAGNLLTFFLCYCFVGKRSKTRIFLDIAERLVRLSHLFQKPRESIVRATKQLVMKVVHNRSRATELAAEISVLSFVFI